jgi:hypothetical protein
VHGVASEARCGRAAEQARKTMEPPMTNVPVYRLHALRIVYFLIVLFLGFTIWPGIIHHTRVWPMMDGVARAMLAAVAIVAAIGIRFPLQMLPILFFEIAWKSLWLIAVGLPLWSANQLDPDSAENAKACLIGVVLFSLVMPWSYVFRSFLRPSPPSDPLIRDYRP